METIYYHSSFLHLEEVFRRGFLKVPERKRSNGYTPVIWLSKNKRWEPMANEAALVDGKMEFLTTEEQFSLIGLARIGIQFTSKLVSWKKYKHIGNIDLEKYISEEQVGIEIGANPNDWFCSLKNIPLSDCTSFEFYDGLEWKELFKEEPSIQMPAVTLLTNALAVIAQKN